MQASSIRSPLSREISIAFLKEWIGDDDGLLLEGDDPFLIQVKEW